MKRNSGFDEKFMKLESSFDFLGIAFVDM